MPPGKPCVQPSPAVRTATLTLLTLAYPLLVYFGLGHFEPRWLSVLLLVMALARLLATRERIWLAAAVGALVLAGLSFWGNQLMPLKLYPVLISAALLGVFGTSLRYPPSAVERIARLREPQLPPQAVAYTRRVTQLWCGFFVVNGSLALATALWASDATWALYNGMISYLLMGTLFAGEWLVRRRLKARLSHG